MLIDQHLHTNFSWDCYEPLENYLKLTKNPIMTTEHLDYYDFEIDGDCEPDYEAYVAEIDYLSKKYNRKIYKGLEVGYTSKDRERINQYLEGKEYDLIMLAIHQDGEVNFMSRAARNLSQEVLLDRYLDLVITALKEVDYAQVLAHLDFGMRLTNIPYSLVVTREAKIKEIMELLVEKKMALEVNTRSLYQYGNEDMYEFFLKVYQSVGGTMVSLGSDTHSTGWYMYEFDRAIKFLKRLGIHQVTQADKGVLHLVDLV